VRFPRASNPTTSAMVPGEKRTTGQRFAKPDSRCRLRIPVGCGKVYDPGSKMLEGRAQLLHVSFWEIE
jgi:hypothetical protein